MSNGFIGAVSARAETSGYTKEQANALFPDKTSGTPQDFAAMPTINGDPVVESGSNADGEWTRWADGTQEVTGAKTLLYSTQYSMAVLWTFPVTFASTPFYASWAGRDESGTGFSDNARGKGSVICDNATTTSVGLSYAGPAGTFVAGQQALASAIAKGRWK